MTAAVDTHKKHHPFHIVDPSPWPFVASLSGFVTALGLILLIHDFGALVLYVGFAMLIFTAYGWWRDVIQESKTDAYTSQVQNGLRMGMAFFITSEVMFFFAFFWAYFNASLFPTAEIGSIWPPQGIETINAFDFPYLNTLILLLSGTTITWAHHALLDQKKKEVVQALAITVMLGFLFTSVQAFEYMHATFGFSENIYTSNFYMTTGFHGVHVIIGTLFLLICLMRARTGAYTPKTHIGFEAAAWYWHFVDVVWLFLFVSIYWWGSGV